MNEKARFVGAALCGIVCLVASRADAGSPVFGIHTQQDWEDALADGRIQPVPDGVFQAMVDQGSDLPSGRWPEPYDTQTEFFTPQVYATQQPYGGEDALVMTWGQSSVSDYSAAAWDYVYPSDPSLNGLALTFSIFPPWQSTHFSLNLVEADPTRWREFVWHASGNPGDPIPGVWNTVTINPTTGTANLNPIVFNSPNGFDITQVARLRFDENIPPPPPGPLPPPPVPAPGLPLFNLWNHVEVSPEPSTLAVWSLLAGLATAMGWRRRR